MHPPVDSLKKSTGKVDPKAGWGLATLAIGKGIVRIASSIYSV
jgi:hypothetical protein